MSLELEDQYDKIFKYCYFKINNQQIAEDLTQETFLKFIKQNTYINQGKQLAYLYTIAKHLCIDYYKSNKDITLDNLEQKSTSNTNVIDNINNIDNTDSIVQKISINQAVATLDHDMQEIVLLRFVNELSIKEISTITDQSRFAVYRKIKTSLETLKKALSEEDFYE